MSSCTLVYREKLEDELFFSKIEFLFEMVRGRCKILKYYEIGVLKITNFS